MSKRARKLLPLLSVLLVVAAVPATAPASVRVKAADDEDSGALQQRQDWFWQQRAGPNGVPRGALARAQHQARQVPRGGPAHQSGSALAPPSGLFPAPGAVSPGYQWALIGPKPINSAQPDPSSPWSGRVAAIAPDPSNSQTVYLGAASGGVWKTTNAGS